MSINNPIIPPGSPLQRSQPAKNSKLVLAVSVILTVHVFVLAGLLIQGCKKQDTGAAADQELVTNSQPSFAPATKPSAPIGEQPNSAPALDTVSAPTNSPRPVPSTPAPATAATAPNLTVNDSPPTTASARTPAVPRVSGGPAHADQEGGQITYAVKSGDTLTKIAKAHGTTVKAIRALNDLKTDRILAGQKIKVPAAGSTASAAENPTPLAASSTPR